jgi:hypothetical protein
MTLQGGVKSLPKQGTTSEPHLLIRNNSLSQFWRTCISPNEISSKDCFISKLSKHLASPGSNSARSNDVNEVQPSSPSGYELNDSKVSTLLRNRPLGMLQEILSSIDLDSTGIISIVKLDLATSCISFTTSLRDTIVFLAQQYGRKIVLPSYSFKSTETSITTTLSLFKSEESDLIDNVASLNLFSKGSDECVYDAIQNQV